MRRGRILILLGLVLALGATGAVLWLLRNTAQQPGEAPVEREPVVVAVQPIAEDEPVEGRLEVREMPKEMIPEAALRELSGTSGKFATGPIPQGTLIQPEMLQTQEEKMREGQVSQLVEEGFLAVALPINELSSVSYGILPGDHIDILITLPFIDVDTETQMKQPICPSCPTEGGASAQFTEQRQRLISQLTLQDVAVLGVGRWTYKPIAPEEGEAQQNVEGSDAASSAGEPPQYITLMLTPQDALVVKLARENNAAIDLAVRKKDDHTMFNNIQPVTLDYIMLRFGITVPTKHEYAVEALPPK